MREFGIASIVLLLALNSVSGPTERTVELGARSVRVDPNDQTPVHERLRVLTYNTFLRPPPVGWGDRNMCRARHIGRRLADEPIPRDIVVLNESFDTEAVGELTDIAAARFPYQVVSLPKAHGFRTSGGVSVLSRYPIEISSAERFRSCSGEFNDCMATKGFVWALVRVSRHLKVNVLATHLNSGRDSNARQARREQLEQIRDFVRSKRDFQRWPTLLMGDLNLDGLRWSGRDPATDKLTEYARTMSLLGNNCAQCDTAGCLDACNPFPVDAFRRSRGRWRFDPMGTDAANTYNCTGQTLTPCDSPNDRMRWRDRMRIDYVMHFGPPTLAPKLQVRVAESSTVAFKSNACGTTYLSDHSGVQATVDISRGAALRVGPEPVEANSEAQQARRD